MSEQKIRTSPRENLVFLADAQKIILDVSSILNSEIGSSQSYPIKEKIKDFDKDIKVVNEVVGKVTLNHLEENSLSGFFNLETALVLICTRCLKKFKKPISLNYEQTFTTKKEEDTFPILGNKTIDIFPSIRQEILLSVPIKPLCSDKCKGIK
jgi:uncharacterized protein